MADVAEEKDAMFGIYIKFLYIYKHAWLKEVIFYCLIRVFDIRLKWLFKSEIKKITQRLQKQLKVQKQSFVKSSIFIPEGFFGIKNP